MPPLFVSLPSLDENSCDQITGVPGSYRKIIRGIEICENANIEIGINIVYSAYSVCNADKIISFLNKHSKISHVSISPVIPPEYDRGNNKFVLTNDDLINVKDTLLAVEQKTNVSVGSSIPLPLCIVGTELLNRNHTSMCIAGRAHCTIDLITGSVNACSHLDNNSCNIYKDGLKECWKHLANWRDDSLLNEECRDCKHLSICSGECRILTKNGSKLKLNHNVDIKLETGKEMNTIDFNRRYRMNKNVKIREESFGSTIFVYNRYLFVGKATSSFLKMLKKDSIFELGDFENLIQFDNNFTRAFKQLLISGVILECDEP